MPGDPCGVADPEPTDERIIVVGTHKDGSGVLDDLMRLRVGSEPSVLYGSETERWGAHERTKHSGPTRVFLGGREGDVQRVSIDDQVSSAFTTERGDRVVGANSGVVYGSGLRGQGQPQSVVCEKLSVNASKARRTSTGRVSTAQESHTQHLARPERSRVVGASVVVRR